MSGNPPTIDYFEELVPMHESLETLHFWDKVDAAFDEFSPDLEGRLELVNQVLSFLQDLGVQIQR
jgi:hypothetical protein